MLLRVECISESLIFKNTWTSDFIVCRKQRLILPTMKIVLLWSIKLVLYLPWSWPVFDLHFLPEFRAGRQMLLTHAIDSVAVVSVFTFTLVGPLYVETASKAAAMMLTKGALIYICIRKYEKKRFLWEINMMTWKYIYTISNFFFFLQCEGPCKIGR